MMMMMMPMMMVITLLLLLFDVLVYLSWRVSAVFSGISFMVLENGLLGDPSAQDGQISVFYLLGDISPSEEIPRRLSRGKAAS